MFFVLSTWFVLCCCYLPPSHSRSTDGLHTVGGMVSEFFRATLRNETNANLLEQYAVKYMETRAVSMENEFSQVTSLLGRHFLMLSSMVDTFDSSIANDSFHGYAFTSVLNHYFGESSGLILTACSDSSDANEVIAKNLSPSQWIFNKSPSMDSSHSNSTTTGHSCNTTLGNAATSRYHLIVHVCTSPDCFFELPSVHNCSASSLIDFVSVRTASSLPSGSCTAGQAVVSYTPCMISRYVCLEQDFKLLQKDQRVRNSLAAFIFNTTAFQLWASSFADDKKPEEVPALFSIRRSKNFAKDCSKTPNLMLMSLSFSNHVCCSNPVFDDNRRFAAVATSICHKGSPKQIIDTSSLGLLLKYRLQFSRSTLAFLIDTDGRAVIYHPDFPFVQSISFDDLSRPAFNDTLLVELLHIYITNFSTLHDADNDRHFVFNYHSKSSFDVYAHKFSLTSNWVLVFLVNQSETFQRLLPRVKVVSAKEDHFLPTARFHRAFTFEHSLQQRNYPKDSPCSLFRYNVSFDSAAVFFSNIAFEDPSKQEATLPTMKSDSSEDKGPVVPSKSLLRDYSPSHVQLLSRLSHAWQIHAAFSSLKPYIVRRMAATNGGVHLMFPASFEPHAEWRASVFRAVFRSPGTVIATRPFLDPTGFGYIVMFAQASSPFIAVAVDFSLGFASNGLLMSAIKTLPGGSSTDFYLMNSNGYMVASLANSTSRHLTNSFGPAERFHASQLEPDLFADMLQRGFVSKTVCAQFGPVLSTRSSSLLARRFLIRFAVNTSAMPSVSLGSSSSSFAIQSSRPCSPYNIFRLSPSSDLFLIRVNRTCPIRTQICPCSIVGRTCLSCANTYSLLFSPQTCECPCECSHLSRGSAYKPSIQDACPSETEFPAVPSLVVHSVETSDNNNHLPIMSTSYSILVSTCPLQLCSSYKLPNCSGAIGCELCQRDHNGKAVKPFCATIKTCFGGTLGGVAPYADWRNGDTLFEDHILGSVTPLVPSGMSPFSLVLSCVALSLVLASVLVYACHRSRNMNFVAAIRSTISSQHLDPAATNRLLNNLDPDGCDNMPQNGNNHWGDSAGGPELVASSSAVASNDQHQPQQTLLLAVFDQPAVQSAMSSSIRRPRPPPSDMGYSSSMPNEDSATEDSSAASVSALPNDSNSISNNNANVNNNNRWNISGLTNIADIFPTTDIFSSRTPSPRSRSNIRSQHNVIDCL